MIGIVTCTLLIIMVRNLIKIEIILKHRFEHVLMKVRNYTINKDGKKVPWVNPSSTTTTTEKNGEKKEAKGGR